MPWRARGGPDLGKLQQTWVHEGPYRVQVPDWCDTADGETHDPGDRDVVGVDVIDEISEEFVKAKKEIGEP